MDASVLSTYDISIPTAQEIEKIYDELRVYSNVSFDTQIQFNFNPFELFRHNTINYYGPVLQVSNNQYPAYLSFPEISYRLYKGKFSNDFHLDTQTWGYIQLQKDYGHILIKTETLLDKIHDIIEPIELDFEDDIPFSRKFYVITDDKQKTVFMLSPQLRREMLAIETSDILIEIMGDKLIIGNKKKIDLSSAISIARFVQNIAGKF